MRGRSGWSAGRHLGHASGEPAVAAAPVVLHIGSVEEEAVGLLQAVEVGDHLVCVAVEVLAVAGGAVGFELQHGEHVHVVHPEAGLGREALQIVERHDRFGVSDVGLRRCPLAVCPGEAELQVLRIVGRERFGLDGDLERHDAEDGVVDVVPLRRAARAARQHWVEEGDQAVAQRVVMGEGSEGHRAVEGADIRIAGEPRALRAGDEVLGERLADLGGRDATRPGGEVAGRDRSGLYISSFGGAARRLGLRARLGRWADNRCGRGGRRGRGLRGQCGGGEQEGCAEERDGPEVHGFILERLVAAVSVNQSTRRWGGWTTAGDGMQYEKGDRFSNDCDGQLRAS
jgi:fructose-specific component phosphotransferase system IIB-like protein